jgi:hypothetical protein
MPAELGFARAAIDFSSAPLSAQTPSDMSAVVKQEQASHQYWILATYQSQNGASEETKFNLAQGFDWLGAQVAIKHGSH